MSGSLLEGYPLGLRGSEFRPLDADVRNARREEALAALRGGFARPVLDAAMYESGLSRRTVAPADFSRGPRWHVVIPVRGRHDLLADCLAGLTTLREEFDTTIVCHRAESAAVSQAVSSVGPDLVRIVSTREAQGFAANCNAGVSPAWSASDRVLFLNSDADPSPLRSLSVAFDAALDIADAAGPCGPNVSGFQSVSPPWPSDVTLAAMPRVIRAPTPRLVGWAFAVRFGAFLEVGGWDESFGLGNFDDDDLSLRIALNSPTPLRLAYVPSAFVGHVGSASFAELPDAEDTYDRLLRENGAAFRRRWEWAMPEIQNWWRRS